MTGRRAALALTAALLAAGAGAPAQAQTAPGAPTVAPAARSTDALSVSWTAVPGAADYDVQYRKKGETAWEDGPQDVPGTSAALAGLEANRAHEVRVRSASAGGSSAWSAAAEGWTHAPEVELHRGDPRIPRDVAPGGRFRLLFVTRDGVAATSANPGTYHTVANSPVNVPHGAREEGSPGFKKHRGQRALVSTPGVSARVHTDTTVVGDDAGVPIYWGRQPGWWVAEDHKVADDYADFHDGSWANESGATGVPDFEVVAVNPQPWTGSSAAGQELTSGGASQAMGQPSVGIGGLGRAGSSPLAGGTVGDNTQQRPLYLLSQVYRAQAAPRDPPLPGPRVLLDTTLTVGSYDSDGDGEADAWGYSNPAFDFSNWPALGPNLTALEAGSLGGDGFVYRGWPGYIHQLIRTVGQGGGHRWLATWGYMDASLRERFEVGIELSLSGDAERGRLNPVEPIDNARLVVAYEAEPDTAVDYFDIPAEAGEQVAVRVLDLNAEDVWSGRLVAGVRDRYNIGFDEAVGTLSPRRFRHGGVEYRIDELRVEHREDLDRSRTIRFQTTPDLPPGVLRLAAPINDGFRTHTAFGERMRYQSLARHYRSADADYRWFRHSVPGDTRFAREGGAAADVYLTQYPGDPLPDRRTVWEGTVTPQAAGAVTGYRRAGRSLEGVGSGTAGVGAVTPDTFTFEGVSYRVDAVAVQAQEDALLATTPRLPANRRLVMEWTNDLGLRHPHEVRQAEAAPWGHRWRNRYKLSPHHWDNDLDGDGRLDPRRVRLTAPLPPLAASASRVAVSEGAGTVEVVLTVTRGGDPVAYAADTLTVTVGADGDGAAAPGDYAAVAARTVAVAAGATRVAVPLSLEIVDDGQGEEPEQVTITAQLGAGGSAAARLVIEDDDRVIEYLSAWLEPERTFWDGYVIEGYAAGPDGRPYGGRLVPNTFRCCRGEPDEDARLTVRNLGRADLGRVLFNADLPSLSSTIMRVGSWLGDVGAGVTLRTPYRAASGERGDYIGSIMDAAGFPTGPAEVRITGPDFPGPEAVAVVSLPGAGAAGNRRYGAGETLEVAVTFNEPVFVTGAPTLAVEVGANARQAVYDHGSGSATLVFAYPVRSGDLDADGIRLPTRTGSLAGQFIPGPDTKRLGVSLPAGAAVKSAAGWPAGWWWPRAPEFPAHKVDGSRAQPAEAALSVRDAAVAEDAGTVTMTVALSYASDSEVLFGYSTADGSATAGADYAAVAAGAGTVPANARTATFAVPILDDAAAEGAETFTVAVTAPAVADGTATVTIADDEFGVGVDPPASAAGAPAHLFEGEAAAAGGAWTVRATAPAAADLPVRVRVTEAGGDFVPDAWRGERTVVIPAGRASAALHPVEDDNADEPHGTVTVTVLPGPGYAVAAGRGGATVAVRDDDFTGAPLAFAVAPAAASVVEGRSAAFEQVVRTVADGTFTEPGDLARAAPGFEAAALAWGATTLVGEADASDVEVAASSASLSAADFEPFAAADGGTGLEARRALGPVSAVADGLAEGEERLLVALERRGGGAGLLRGAAHPGAPGVAAPLSGRDFHRAAVAVRDQSLALQLAAELAEGGRTAVTATLSPPAAEAFTVTVALGASGRLAFAGAGRTLSFAAGATASTGAVTVAAVDNALADGDLTETVTGTPSLASVPAAVARVRVLDRDSWGGLRPVLWETELTVGSYDTDGVPATVERYGYAQGGLPGIDPVTAGALGSATFEFMGVEYTVRRLTLTSAADHGAHRGEFHAVTAGGHPLRAGPDPSPRPVSTAGDPTVTPRLGLEVETAAGGAVVRMLDHGADAVGVLAPYADWGSLTAGSGRVTVRLLDLGPPAYWEGRATAASAGGAVGYWVSEGTVAGSLVPETFEVPDPGGGGTFHAVDRLSVAGAEGARKLALATTPDLPAGRLAVLATRRDGLYGTGAGAAADAREVYHVFPVRASAASSAAGVDYEFASPEGDEGLHHGIGRAFLVPMAGAAALPPTVEEVLAWDLEVGEKCDRGPASACEVRMAGYDSGANSETSAEHVGRIRRAPGSEGRAFRRQTFRDHMHHLGFMEFPSDGQTALAWGHRGIDIGHDSIWNQLADDGFAVRSDQGVQVYWWSQAEVLLTTDQISMWEPVRGTHGWRRGQVRRVSQVRPRRGPTTLRLAAPQVVSTAGLSAHLPLKVPFTAGFREALPRSMDTVLTVSAGEGVGASDPALDRPHSVDVTVPAGRTEVSGVLELPAWTPPPGFAGFEARVPPLRPFGLMVAAEGFTETFDAVAIESAGAVPGELEYWLGEFTGQSDRYASQGVAPDTLACCRGRSASETERSVGIVAGEGERTHMELKLTGLADEDKVLAPEVRGLVLEIGDLRLSVDDGEVRDDTTVRWPVKPGLLYHERLRLTGPDHPVLESVEVISTPRSGTAPNLKYGAGETIEIALVFDEAVTSSGHPGLSFAIGTSTRYAPYAYGNGTRRLVFAYEVSAGAGSLAPPDRDDDGIDVGVVAQALDMTEGESIVSVAHGRPAVGLELDPAVFANHKVDGSLRPPAPEPTLADGAVGEGEGAFEARVALSHPAASATSYDWETVADSATAPADFRAAKGTLRVPAGRRFGTFEVAIEDDAVEEPDEAFELRLTRSGTEVAKATVTIRDDDAPMVTLAQPAAAASHLFEHEPGSGEARHRWTLRRDSDVPDADLGALTVRVSASETGGDFVPAADEGLHDVTFAAGEATVSFTPIVNDTADEAHGTVAVWLAPGPGYALPDGAGDTGGTVAVRDDDGDLLSVTVDPEALTVDEGRSAQFAAAGATVADGTFTAPADLGRVFGGTALGVSASTADGTATAGADYTPLAEGSAAELAFAAAKRSGSGREAGLTLRAALPAVATVKDGPGEGDETFSVSVALPAEVDPRVALGTPATATATLREGPTVTLALDDDELTEGEKAKVTGTVDPVHGQAFTVTVALDASGRYGFEGAGRTLSFAANAAASTGTVEIRATANATDDGDLEAEAAGTASDAAVRVEPAAFTVLDDDLPTVRLAAPALAGTGTEPYLFEFEAAKSYATAVHADARAELETRAAWTLTREGVLDDALEVTVRASEGAAGDFLAAADEGTHRVTFDANEATATFKIVTDDDDDEAHGSVTVTLVDGTDYDVAGTLSSTVAVRDDEDAAVLAVAPADRTVGEGQAARFEAVLDTRDDGAQAGTFTAAADVPRALRERGGALLGTQRPLRLAWDTEPREAAPPGDFRAVSQRPLLDPAAAAALPGGGYRARAALTAIQALDNDDGVAGTADDAEEIADERLTARLSPAAGEVRIGPGRQVALAARDNVADLVDADNAAVPLSGDGFLRAVVTIQEDAGVELVLSPETLVEGSAEDETTVTARLDLGQDAAFDISVSAASDDDRRWEFVGPNRTLSFAANETESTGTVKIRALDNDFDDRALEVTVTGTPPAAANRAAGEATLTIEDDDLPEVHVTAPRFLGRFGFLLESDSAAGTGHWEVHRESDDIGAPLAVTLTVSERGGGDFVPAAVEASDQTVTIPANEIEAGGANGLGPIAIDAVDEPHGTVTVAVKANPNRYRIRGGASSASAPVRDDDGELLTVTVDPGAASVAEGDPVELTVRAATPMDGTFARKEDLEVVFIVTSLTVSAASADGTATAGEDYTALPSGAGAVLRFSDATVVGSGATAGLTLSKRLPAMATVDDGDGDADETFTVALGLPANVDGRIKLGTPAASTVTLREGPTVALALGDAELAEGGRTQVTGTVDPAHDAAFTVAVALDPAASDRYGFEGANRTLSFAALATASTGTVTLEAKANEADDGDLEAEVTGTADDSAVDVDPVAFRVLDDDDPKVSVSAPGLASGTGGFVYEFETADEAKAGQWRLQREGLLDEQLAVQVSVSESGSGDFVAALAEGAAQAVTFAAGHDMASYTPVTVDAVDEGHGTVTVSVAPGAGYEVKGSAASAAVRDDDGSLLTVTVDGAVSVPEGDPARFSVNAATVADGTFTEASHLERLFGAASLTVPASSADGTAVAGEDYTALASDAGAALAFSTASAVGAGSARGLTLKAGLPDIATVDDGDGDADETFTVTIALPSAADPRIGLGTPFTGTATLREGPTVTLALADADGELSEGQATAVTGTVDPVHDAAFTVAVALDPAASDRYGFQGANRTLSFAALASSSTGTVTLEAKANEADDGDVEAEVTGTTAAADVDVDPVAFRVLDDDDPKVSVAAPSLASGSGGFVYEDETAVNLDKADARWWLTREGLADAELEVSVTVAETGGGDFVLQATEDAAQTVTFAVDAMTVSYSPVTVDTTDEGHGRVTVTVAPGTGYDVKGSAAAAAVRDDDGSGLLTAGFANKSVTVAEGAAAKLAVKAETVDDGTFTAPAHLGRVFGVDAVDVNAATGGGTATAGTDYTALAAGAKATLAFADFTATGSGASAGLALEAVALPDIATLEDTTDDDNETFLVTLTLPTGAEGAADDRIALKADPEQATVKIVEGPPNGTLRICGADGACADQAGISCPATDKLCLTGEKVPVPLEGRIEVAHDGEYGTVCDDYWTDLDAGVACRQLGHAGAAAALTGSPFGGAAEGVRIWLDNVRCTGAEARLYDCPRQGRVAPGTHDCSMKHAEDAGARCVASDGGAPAAQGKLVFRVDGTETEGSASLTAAAGSLPRYGVRLSQAPRNLEPGWRSVRMDVSVASPGRGVAADPDRAYWHQPDVEESDWSELRGITLDIPSGARGEVAVTHRLSRNGNPHSDYDSEHALALTVTAADASRTPGAPGGLEAQVENGTDVSLAWDAPADPGAGTLQGYRVQTRAGSGAWERLEAVGRAALHHADALKDAASRSYRVAAANAHGQGPWSAAVRVDRPASSPASAPAASSCPDCDGPAPRLAAAWADGSVVALRFDRPLDAGFAPVPRDFMALSRAPDADRWRAHRVRAVQVSGATLLLLVAPPVAAGDAVAASYLRPALHPLRGALGGEAAALSDVAADNRTRPGAPGPGLRPLSVRTPGLAAAVAEALAAAGTDDPAGLRVLDASRRGLTDAWEVGALAGLRELNLAGNELADLGPLAALTELRVLDLSGNAADDLWPLAALAGLERLALAGNRVWDAAPLAGLGGLRVLDLSGNAVADLGALRGLAGLEYLALSGARLRDARSLAGLARLLRLDLSGNELSDAAALADMSRLVWVDLSGNRVWSADGLGRLVRLRWVWLGDNPLPPDARRALPPRARTDLDDGR